MVILEGYLNAKNTRPQRRVQPGSGSPLGVTVPAIFTD